MMIKIRNHKLNQMALYKNHSFLKVYKYLKINLLFISKIQLSIKITIIVIDINLLI